MDLAQSSPVLAGLAEKRHDAKTIYKDNMKVMKVMKALNAS